MEIFTEDSFPLRRVSFSEEVEVSYTFAAEDYDRQPIEPPALTSKDYFEYQVMAFEMAQSIKFEMTMRELGLWESDEKITIQQQDSASH